MRRARAILRKRGQSAGSNKENSGLVRIVDPTPQIFTFVEGLFVHGRALVFHRGHFAKKDIGIELFAQVFGSGAYERGLALNSGWNAFSRIIVEKLGIGHTS